jgi:hypothetical protein
VPEHPTLVVLTNGSELTKGHGLAKPSPSELSSKIFSPLLVHPPCATALEWPAHRPAWTQAEAQLDNTNPPQTPPHRTPFGRALLIRGFGVQVPDGAPVELVFRSPVRRGASTRPSITPPKPPDPPATGPRSTYFHALVAIGRAVLPCQRPGSPLSGRFSSPVACQPSPTTLGVSSTSKRASGTSSTKATASCRFRGPPSPARASCQAEFREPPPHVAAVPHRAYDVVRVDPSPGTRDESGLSVRSNKLAPCHRAHGRRCAGRGRLS